MAYGISLYSDSGNLLVNSDLPTYRFIGKYSFSTYYGPPSGGLSVRWNYATVTSKNPPQAFVTNVNMNNNISGSTIGFSTLCAVVRGKAASTTTGAGTPRTVINMADVTGLTVGDTLADFGGATGVEASPTITAIDTVNKTITLSSAITVGIGYSPLVFLNSSRPDEWSCIFSPGIAGSGYIPTDTTYLYVFGTTYNTLTSGYGIQVYDASGNVVMNAENRLLSISGYAISPNVPQTNLPNPLTDLSTTTLTAGTIPSSYAHNCCSPGSMFVSSLFSFGLYIGARKNTSTTFSFCWGGLLGASLFGGSGNYYSIIPNRVIQFIDTTLYN